MGLFPAIFFADSFVHERDGMKVMDAGEVGEIVQGGVQVGIGNLAPEFTSNEMNKNPTIHRSFPNGKEPMNPS